MVEARLLFRYGEQLEYEAEIGQARSCICLQTCRTPCLKGAVDLDVFIQRRAGWLTPEGKRYFSGALALAGRGPRH